MGFQALLLESVKILIHALAVQLLVCIIASTIITKFSYLIKKVKVFFF